MRQRTLNCSLCLTALVTTSLATCAWAGSGRFGSGTAEAARSSGTASAGSNAASRPYSTTPSTFGNTLTVPGANDAMSSPNAASSTSSAPSFSSMSSTSSIDMAPNSSNTKPSSGSGGGYQTNSQRPGSLPLRGLVGGPGTAAGATGGSIESFFQISPVNSQTATPETHPASTVTKRQKPTNGALWHIMDNIGVPMFGGSHEDSLAPEIRRNYVNPELPNPDKFADRRHPNPQSQISAEQKNKPEKQIDKPSATTINTRKIPESELEGIEIPARKDAKQETK